MKDKFRRTGRYQKIYGERKRRILALWRKNGSFYAGLTAVDEITGRKSTRRVRLGLSRTVAEATTALRDLQEEGRDRNLPVLKRSPRLSDYWADYFKFYDQVRPVERGDSKGGKNLGERKVRSRGPNTYPLDAKVLRFAVYLNQYYPEFPETSWLELPAKQREHRIMEMAEKLKNCRNLIVNISKTCRFEIGWKGRNRPSIAFRITL